MCRIQSKELVSELSHYKSTRTVLAIAREAFASSLGCWNGSILGLTTVTLIPGAVAVPWANSRNPLITMQGLFHFRNARIENVPSL